VWRGDAEPVIGTNKGTQTACSYGSSTPSFARLGLSLGCRSLLVDQGTQTLPQEPQSPEGLSQEDVAQGEDSLAPRLSIDDVDGLTPCPSTPEAADISVDETFWDDAWFESSSMDDDLLCEVCKLTIP
jgi:hypothetical protein